MAEKKPTWYLKIGPGIGAVLTLIWLARVWFGDNPTDRTVLLVLAMITVTLTIVMAGIIKKRNTTQ